MVGDMAFRPRGEDTLIHESCGKRLRTALRTFAEACPPAPFEACPTNPHIQNVRHVG